MMMMDCEGLVAERGPREGTIGYRNLAQRRSSLRDLSEKKGRKERRARELLRRVGLVRIILERFALPRGSEKVSQVLISLS